MTIVRRPWAALLVGTLLLALAGSVALAGSRGGARARRTQPRSGQRQRQTEQHEWRSLLGEARGILDAVEPRLKVLRSAPHLPEEVPIGPNQREHATQLAAAHGMLADQIEQHIAGMGDTLRRAGHILHVAQSQADRLTPGQAVEASELGERHQRASEGYKAAKQRVRDSREIQESPANLRNNGAYL
jgi:hypothetical protein